jgi:septal ring factor EnvC (AmiA/AmiB activator)
MKQLPTVLLVIAILMFVAVAPAQEQVRQALDLQNRSIEASADIQRRIDALDDETRKLLDEYRRTMAQVEDLAAYNEQLERLVATQRVELADFERKFQEIEVTKRQILPLIMRMT